jgi:hypothetical protein
MRLALICVALATASCASAGSAPARDDAALFQRMKSLAGTWTSTGQGDAPDGAQVTYRVTAAGSAVEETIFRGSPHEMVTLYTLDRGLLVLTHYCALGNQPRMEVQPGGSDAGFAFECVSLGNGDVAKDMHMHSAKFSFPDADHVESAWTMWKEGAAGDTVHISLKRAAN